ncbi:DUF4325 domain-containing protein [Psychroflexus sp. CAK1W]|uniref:STAS-like domain-containing protein n=1 Tax=Psychroflexus curvus TaxID=2873595 RepID=UPI001CCF8DC1|nr:DUF4325 domain-containing protein [Psychroflexus curvus]MBZ9627447.1 DUF4325 domain-containing protein [Psychroflexus curvus]
MKTMILRNLVSNAGSVDEGAVLFNHLKEAFRNGQYIVLEIDSDMSLSSSFLNSSVGQFLDEYGFLSFKKTIKFKGSKTQFQRLNKYIQDYKSLYLA